MTKSGKQVLGIIFLLCTLAVGIGYIYASLQAEASENVSANEAADNMMGLGSDPSGRPNPILYLGAAAASLVGSFVMFNMASNDQSSDGLFKSSRPSQQESNAEADEGTTDDEATS